MSLASEELASLSVDVAEVYSDYGTDELYVKRLLRTTEDDVYDELVSIEYADNIKVKGRVSCEVKDNTTLGLGDIKHEEYTITLLKTSYPKILTDKDILIYQGMELVITSIGKSGVIGDDFLQYVVRAKPNGK